MLAGRCAGATRNCGTGPAAGRAWTEPASPTPGCPACGIRYTRPRWPSVKIPPASPAPWFRRATGRSIAPTPWSTALPEPTTYQRGLMLLIGELINATRKKVGAAVEARDAQFIRDLAQRQAAAGADVLDVNGGVPGREAETLEWLIGVVQEATDLPLSADPSDFEALWRALALCN